MGDPTLWTIAAILMAGATWIVAFRYTAPVVPAEQVFGWFVLFPAIVSLTAARYLSRSESTSWAGDILSFAGVFVLIGTILGLCVFV